MKIRFRALFPLFAGMEGLSGNAFPRKGLLKQGKSYSDDSQTMQFASSCSLLSLHKQFSASSKTYCKNYQHSSQTWKANNLLLVWNADNLSIQAKLGPEIPFSLILKVVLIKWHNVGPNLYRQYKMRTADCCRALFSPWKWQRENSPPTVFLTPWKQSSAVCILYCPGSSGHEHVPFFSFLTC